MSANPALPDPVSPDPASSGRQDDRIPNLGFWLGWLVVALSCGWTLFSDLGHYDLDNDEAIYAHAVESIVYQGEWQTPYLSPGIGPMLEKPPLQLWIVAAGMVFGGLPVDEWGFRFPAALMSLGGFLYLYLLAWRRSGALGGIVACFTVLTISSLINEHGLRAHAMEAPLFLAYCGGIWHWLAWSRSQIGTRRAWGHLLAFVLYFVLGFLTKFVAAIFLPAVAFLAAALVPECRRRLWQEKSYLLATSLVGLLLIAPWFVLEHLEFGQYFWQIILGSHVVQRFTTYLDPGHLKPFHYYFSSVAAELGPAFTWPWVLGGLVLWLLPRRQRHLEDWLIPAWAIFPLVAISFGSSKIIHYAYPFLPPLGCLAAYACVSLFESLAATKKVWMRFVAGVIGLGVLVGLLHGWREVWTALRSRPRVFLELQACLAAQRPMTVVDQGKAETLFYFHLFQSDTTTHTIPFYLHHSGTVQHLNKPDDVLLFFRLWATGHQSAVLTSDLLESTFRNNLEDPNFRAQILALASQLGNRAEAEALLAGPLEWPAKIRLYDRFDLFLPGPYAACLPAQP